MRDPSDMTKMEMDEEAQAEALAELNQFAKKEREVYIADIMVAKGKHLMDIISCDNSISVQKSKVEGYNFLVTGMVPFQSAPYYVSLEEILDDFLTMESDRIDMSIEFDFNMSKKDVDYYEYLIRDWEITRNWRDNVLPD